MTINPAHKAQGLKPISREEMLKPYVEVAEGMETQFTNHLIEQMRRTVPRETELSSAESYYESLIDNERAKTMAQSDTGLGLKNVILEQIVPAHLKQQPSAHTVRNAYQANVKGVDE